MSTSIGCGLSIYSLFAGLSSESASGSDFLDGNILKLESDVRYNSGLLSSYLLSLLRYGLFDGVGIVT